MNQRFTEVTQYSRDELLGREGMQFLGDQYSQEELRDIWESLLHGEEWRSSAKSHRKDGTSYWAQCFITPVRDSNNQITHFLALHDDITELRESTEKITYQATHDLLTGLLNRAEFEKRLDKMLLSARANKETHILCLIDLDQFKIVNDTSGHVAGDELLRQLGSLMRQHIRRSDVLARIGGDEFAILFEHCDTRTALQNAQKIRTLLLEHPFVWDNRTYSAGLSAGMVEITAESPNPTELLREADAACYTAKEMGRNRVQVYSPDDETTARRSNDMLWATRLREAISTSRLALFEQRIMSLDKDGQDSSEILVRMIDENGEYIPPGMFLPAAERYDVAPELDAWVVENTFRHLNANPDFLKQRRYCAINLSGLSFNEEFAQRILDWLREFALPAEKICFEITETAAIANLALAKEFIATLGAQKVLFALDDFGSGLSSFAYLKNLDVDILKIDGQFVRDMLNDQVDEAMVRAINEIGKVMSKHTIAEFVENDALIERLREMDVDSVQGYGVSRPAPLSIAALSKSA